MQRARQFWVLAQLCSFEPREIIAIPPRDNSQRHQTILPVARRNVGDMAVNDRGKIG